MKKIFSLIFVFCVLFAVSYGAVKVVTPAVKNFVSEQSYAPSDEDIAAFEKELGERPFYYYKALDYDKQKAYIMLYNAVLKQEPAVNLIVEEKDLLSVFTAVLYDNPKIFWVSLEYTYYDYKYANVILITKHNPYYHTHYNPSNNYKLMIIGDSFQESLIYFLNTSFQKVERYRANHKPTKYPQRKYNYEIKPFYKIIEKDKPDAILLLRNSGSLEDLLDMYPQEGR